jgi:hypothetical protein
MKHSDIPVPYLTVPQTAAVHLATTAAVSLPEAGKAFVLEHLLSAMKIKTLQALPHEARKEILDQLYTLDAHRQAFVDKYAIATSDSSTRQVRLTLPEGTSPIEFITEADKLARALYNWRVASPQALGEWQRSSSFSQPFAEPTSLTIEGCALNSTNQTRASQEAQGWCNAPSSELIAAHAAFLIATRKDLFNGLTIRSRDGAHGFLPGYGITTLAAYDLFMGPDMYSLPTIGACSLIERTRSSSSK